MKAFLRVNNRRCGLVEGSVGRSSLPLIGLNMSKCFPFEGEILESESLHHPGHSLLKICCKNDACDKKSKI